MDSNNIGLGMETFIPIYVLIARTVIFINHRYDERVIYIFQYFLYILSLVPRP